MLTRIVSQVAVAKHLGLLALRIADSAILPFNTTHYAYELDVYLDKYVFSSCLLSMSTPADGLLVELHKL